MNTFIPKLSYFSLLQSIRFQVVCAAAQITLQFFELMHYAQGPEFEELAAILLQKSAHLNKNVKDLTSKALDSMVTNISPCYCLRVLTSVRGAGLVYYCKSNKTLIHCFCK